MPKDTPEKEHLLDDYHGTNYGTCTLPTARELLIRKNQQFMDECIRKKEALAQQSRDMLARLHKAETLYNELRARQHHSAGATDETSSLRP